MSSLKRMIILASNLLWVFLAINALAIVLGFAVNPPVANGHGQWSSYESIFGMVFALRTFIWLLPLTALMLFISSLVGAQIPVGNQE